MATRSSRCLSGFARFLNMVEEPYTLKDTVNDVGQLNSSVNRSDRPFPPRVSRRWWHMESEICGLRAGATQDALNDEIEELKVTIAKGSAAIRATAVRCRQAISECFVSITRLISPSLPSPVNPVLALYPSPFRAFQTAAAGARCPPAPDAEPPPSSSRSHSPSSK